MTSHTVPNEPGGMSGLAAALRVLDHRRATARAACRHVAQLGGATAAPIEALEEWGDAEADLADAEHLVARARRTRQEAIA